MGEQTACRHNRLYYAPSGHKDGSCSESWYCDSCGEHFNIREPAILRARVAELERELSVYKRSEIVALQVDGKFYGKDEIRGILEANVRIGEHGIALERRNAALCDAIHSKHVEFCNDKHGFHEVRCLDGWLLVEELQTARLRAEGRKQ